MRCEPDRFSAESEDSTSPSTTTSEQRQHGSANPIPSARPSLSGTSPESPSSETFARSTEETSRSSTAATPASPSPKRGADSEQKIHAISGPSSPDAFAFYDQDSLSWKTCQATLFSDSIASSPTWPKWGMTRDGYAYELVTSVPPIDESVFSALLATPTVSDVKGPSPNHAGTLAEHIALLPTPGANDSHGGEGPTRLARQEHGTGGPMLRDIGHLLPTPAAQEPGGTAEQFLERKNRDGHNRTEPTHLSLAVQLLPTPTVQQGRNATSGRSNPNSRHHDGWTLQDVAFAGLLPTPRAQDEYERRNWKTIKRIAEEGGDMTLPSAMKYMHKSHGEATDPPSDNGNESSDEMPPDQLTIADD